MEGGSIDMENRFCPKLLKALFKKLAFSFFLHCDDHKILLTKLEHNGVRRKALDLPGSWVFLKLLNSRVFNNMRAALTFPSLAFFRREVAPL
jgi:hypothetical protein